MICRELLFLEKIIKVLYNVFTVLAEAAMFVNIRKNLKGILLMLLCALALTMGQFVWKLQTYSLEQKLFYIALGLFIYGIGAFVMLFAYRFGSVSVLQPVNSVGYIYALILGALVFGEAISAVKLAGIVLIVAGVVFLAGGDGK